MATHEEKIKSIADITFALQNQMRDLHSMARRAMILLKGAETGEVSMSEKQKNDLMEKYLALKEKVSTTFKELP